jgi:hypothetical protein
MCQNPVAILVRHCADMQSPLDARSATRQLWYMPIVWIWAMTRRLNL